MDTWHEVIIGQDRLVYERTGFGKLKMGLGDKPALLIIDVQYHFVGDVPEPILESIKRFPYSAGEKGWRAVHHIASLLPVARSKHIPIFYAVVDNNPKPAGWLTKKSSKVKGFWDNPAGFEIVKEIAPVAGDIVIPKPRDSMFFATPFLAMLNALRVDTLLVCGCATGGCVRATVTDAWSYNFRVAVIEECTFDRGELNHKVNLFEMDAKYCDVIPIASAKEYLDGRS